MNYYTINHKSYRTENNLSHDQRLACTPGQNTPAQNTGRSRRDKHMRVMGNRWKQSGIREYNQPGDT